MREVMTKIKYVLTHHSTLVLLVAIVLLFSLLSDSFFTFQNFQNILIQSSALTIIAIGMTFVLITAGIDLSVGSLMFLIGVLAGKIVVNDVSMWLIIPVVLLTAALFGFLNAIFIVRLKVIPFVVTLATLYIARGAGLLISDTRAINLPEHFLDLGSARFLSIPIPVIIMAIVIVVSHLTISSTQFGRQLYAVGNNKRKAVIAGINVRSILIKTYVICGLCAGLGGLVAIAQLGAVSPTFGIQSEFTAIAAAVLGGTSLFGGKGKVFPGTFIGAVLIQMIQNGLVIINADPYFHPLVTGAIIFLIVFADSRRNFANKTSWQ